MNPTVLEHAMSTPGLTERPHLEELDFLLGQVADATGDLLEVGVFCGRSLVVMAARAAEFGCRAHGVDPFPAAADVESVYRHGIDAEAREGIARAQALRVDQYDATCDVLGRAGLQASLTRGTVRDWQRDNELTVLRAAFIDGDHVYMAVQHDLRVACAHLVPGGMLIVDDYDFPGVRRAVHELFSFTPLEIVHRNRLLALRSPLED